MDALRGLGELLRVAEQEDAKPTGYIRSKDPLRRWDTPRPTPKERRALQRAIDALEVGTVVERHGTTFAPEHRNRWPGASFGLGADPEEWNAPWDPATLLSHAP